MTHSQNLFRIRKELQAYFSEQAERVGLTIHPATDAGMLDISELLYYEIRESRKIRIFLDKQSQPSLDWYIKDDDFNGCSMKVLALFVDDQLTDKELLWKVYFEWMINKSDIENLLTNG